VSGHITVGRFLAFGTDSVTTVPGGPLPWNTHELTGLVPEEFDYIALSYDGSARVSGAVYRAGGAGGSVVATLSITYVGSSSRIATVART